MSWSQNTYVYERVSPRFFVYYVISKNTDSGRKAASCLQSVFYTQSVMRSPRFILSPLLFTQPVLHVLYWQCKSTQTIPVPTVWETACFYCKRRTNILYTNTTLNRLGFGATASGDFNFQNNESEDMFVHQSNPVGDKLFSYVNTFVGISSFDLFSRKQRWFWSN